MINVNNLCMKKSDFICKHGRVFFVNKQILKFKSPSGIVSDEDINNLFFGLVRLIKRNCELSLEEKYLQKINKLEREIKKLSRCKT